MRRLIAAIGLLSFANLVVLQASGTCLLLGGSTHGPEATSAMSEHAGHAGHSTAANVNDEALQQAPASQSSHAPGCLTMGPCVLTVDVSRAVTAAAPVQHAHDVAALSDHRPASLTLSPELPPPRA